MVGSTVSYYKILEKLSEDGNLSRTLFLEEAQQ